MLDIKIIQGTFWLFVSPTVLGLQRIFGYDMVPFEKSLPELKHLCCFIL